MKLKELENASLTTFIVDKEISISDAKLLRAILLKNHTLTTLRLDSFAPKVVYFSDNTDQPYREMMQENLNIIWEDIGKLLEINKRIAIENSGEAHPYKKKTRIRKINPKKRAYG